MLKNPTISFKKKMLKFQSTEVQPVWIALFPNIICLKLYGSVWSEQNASNVLTKYW